MRDLKKLVMCVCFTLIIVFACIPINVISRIIEGLHDKVLEKFCEWYYVSFCIKDTAFNITVFLVTGIFAVVVGGITDLAWLTKNALNKLNDKIIKVADKLTR